MEPGKQITATQRYLSIQDIYDKYAGMLLGFMVRALKDQQMAEQYLVDFFATLPQHLDKIYNDNTSVWTCLQQLAKKQLALSGSNVPAKVGGYRQDDPVDQMTPRQRTVFLSTYYYGKTVAELADELKTTDDVVRKILKEVFTIIRKGL